MLTLYSYPTLFGVADNNGYGLRVYAFLKLAGLLFTHEHIFDAAAAPRGQLPYIALDWATRVSCGPHNPIRSAIRPAHLRRTSTAYARRAAEAAFIGNVAAPDSE
jgi:hypothetical protein